MNYDPWGIGITYSGYLLLGVSMLWMLVSRGGEFRRLLRHPLLKKGGMFVLLCCVWEVGYMRRREAFRHWHASRRIVLPVSR